MKYAIPYLLLSICAALLLFALNNRMKNGRGHPLTRFLTDFAAVYLLFASGIALMIADSIAGIALIATGFLEGISAYISWKKFSAYKQSESTESEQ